MADYSYQPVGWTCQALANNTAGQNLGYDAHAPNLPGHPSVRPVTGEAAHMMAGAPGDSPGGPVSNDQMRLHQDPTTKKTYADGIPAVNPNPEHDIASSAKEKKLLAGVDHGTYVGVNVSTPQTRDSRYAPPSPAPADRATPEGEKQFEDNQERAGEGPAVTEAKALDKAAGVRSRKPPAGKKAETLPEPQQQKKNAPEVEQDQSTVQPQADK